MNEWQRHQRIPRKRDPQLIHAAIVRENARFMREHGKLQAAATADLIAGRLEDQAYEGKAS